MIQREYSCTCDTCKKKLKRKGSSEKEMLEIIQKSGWIIYKQPHSPVPFNHYCKKCKKEIISNMLKDV